MTVKTDVVRVLKSDSALAALMAMMVENRDVLPATMKVFRPISRSSKMVQQDLRLKPDGMRCGGQVKMLSVSTEETNIQ